MAMACHGVLLVLPRSDVVFIDDRTYLYGRLMISDGVVSPYYVKVEYSSVLSIWEGAADASLIDCRKKRYAYSHPGTPVAAQTLLEVLVEDPTGVVMEGLRDRGGVGRLRSVSSSGRSRKRGSSNGVPLGRRIRSSSGSVTMSDNLMYGSSSGRVVAVRRASLPEEVGVLLYRMYFHDTVFGDRYAGVLLYDLRGLFLERVGDHLMC